MRTGADAGSAELGGKYMKKSISVVTLFPGASQCYAGQIRELFGDLVEVYSYSTSDQSVEKITRTDLYLVSTDAFKIAEEESQYVPADGQVVEIYVGYSKEVIRRLKEIPAGTRVLFVNVTHQMAREAITQLEQSGVNQLQFIPYGPDVFTMEPTFGDDVVPENVKLAVTPDEMDFVPAGMEQVINIGHRPCTANTMIETALRLGLESVMEEKKFQNYIHSMASGNYSFEQMFQRSRNLESQLDLLLEILDEGVIGVNEKGKIFACNQKARVITGMKIRMLLGRPAEQIFPYIPFEKCIREQTQVLERLIRINAANINMTVVPVMRGGRCIGAFSTLQPLSELEKKQNELRSQLRTKGYRAKYNFEDVVGKSQAIEKTKTILKSMAQTESPILLIGETGTGKEIFAHAVHLASSRRDGPFVAINVAAMPENLLESELFGYEEGAFTGAKKGGRPGLFEFAHEGTLFLDEVEGMSMAMQVKLLRVLQEREIMRVGGGAPYRSMLKEIYPGLRKVNCKIDYTVVNFDVEQGRIIIRENPKYLSLNEMYQVANSYPKGSKDFVNVFDIAVRMYPTDAVANLNTGAVALSQKDLNAAVKFMEKADHNTAEFINNTGVYNFLNGDINRAMAAFEQAAKLGNEAALANLKQLQQILSVKMK